MKTFAISLIYLGFFSLLGCAVYWTQSGWPLWALVCMPSVKTKSKKKKRKKLSTPETDTVL